MAAVEPRHPSHSYSLGSRDGEEMTTALITSGEGPLTPALLRELARRGVRAAVMAEHVFTTRHDLPRDAAVATAGHAGVATAMAGCDVVIDNRVPPPRRRSTGGPGVEHVRRTTALAAGATMAGVGRYVHVRSLWWAHGGGWAHQVTDHILEGACVRGLSVARVDLAPLFGPEAGATTEVNALVLRLLLGKLPLVGFGATRLLSAHDAAAGVAEVALDPDCRPRTMAGSRHPYRDIAAVAAESLGRRPPMAVPRHVARLAAAAADRDGRLPRPRFTPAVADPTDHERWPTVLLRQDIEALIDHYRGQSTSR